MSFDQIITNDAQEVLNDIDPDMLEDGRESDFVEEMTKKFQTYGDRTYVTQRQLDWLVRIRDRQTL